MKRRKLASLVIFISLAIFTLKPAFATTMEEVRALQAKAALSMEKLKFSAEAGKDISKIVPMMKKVKTLGDKGKIKEADKLLDKILYEFQLLNSPDLQQESRISEPQTFINPRKVNIHGYHKSAMEAFITGDGAYIFFNNDKDDTPKTDKDIYYAKRIDDTNFKFMGEVKGLNSAQVDGVPTMDRYGNFYFISMVNYTKKNSFATVYSGKFNKGRVSDVQAHPELSLNLPGWINMDVEISPDGSTLYSTQTYFGDGPPPKQSYFFVAHMRNGKFESDPRSNDIFHNINTSDLEYAASISADGLELYFTRLSYINGLTFNSYSATRAHKADRFSAPKLITAISGHAEAPAITSDGRLMYFHKKDKGRFYLYVLERAVK